MNVAALAFPHRANIGFVDIDLKLHGRKVRCEGEQHRGLKSAATVWPFDILRSSTMPSIGAFTCAKSELRLVQLGLRSGAFDIGFGLCDAGDSPFVIRFRRLQILFRHAADLEQAARAIALCQSLRNRRLAGGHIGARGVLRRQSLRKLCAESGPC